MLTKPTFSNLRSEIEKKTLSVSLMNLVQTHNGSQQPKQKQTKRGIIVNVHETHVFELAFRNQNKIA